MTTLKETFDKLQPRLEFIKLQEEVERLRIGAAERAHMKLTMDAQSNEIARLQRVYGYECEIRAQRGEMLLVRDARIVELERKLSDYENKEPVAWMSNKVIHTDPTLSAGYIPLVKA